MPLIVVGINHHTAPVDVRERLALSDREIPSALAELCHVGNVAEGALLSTCNRTEVYAVTPPLSPDIQHSLQTFLASRHGFLEADFAKHFYCRREGAAATHLFSVASGIDSMIVGEPDIQRQVKQALELAQTSKCAGTIINRLFQEAISAGKRARTETGIARGALSVGAAAVELATQIFGDSLAGNTVLVLGAGKMSEVTARHLQAKGAPTVLVANRTYDRAVHLAQQIGGQARHFDELSTALLSADIVICSTAAPHPVVTRELIRDAMRARHNRPLLLIDIAVPRDVESSVDSLPNVYLCNIDDLQQLVAGTRQSRAVEVQKAQEIVEYAVVEYLKWNRSLEVSPLIVAVRARLDAIRLEESSRMRTRLPGLSENEWKIIDAGMQAASNKVAHSAIQTIKSSAQSNDPNGILNTVRLAFGLNDENVVNEPDQMVSPKVIKGAQS